MRDRQSLRGGGTTTKQSQIYQQTNSNKRYSLRGDCRALRGEKVFQRFKTRRLNLKK